MLSLLSSSTIGFAGFDLDADGCVVNYDSNIDYFPPERRAIMGGAISSAEDKYLSLIHI